MRFIIVCTMLALIGLVWNCSSDSTSPDEAEIDGEFLFVEMWIFTYAIDISGDCEPVGPVGHGGNAIYEYIPYEKTLRYIAGKEFPINEQLSMVFAQRQFFVPPSLAGGGDFTWIIPVYFIGDQLTKEAYVEGFNDSYVSLNINLRHFKQGIIVPTDSTFIKVTKVIENGSGSNCVWEWTDSLIVRNYGFIPKKNIIRPF